MSYYKAFKEVKEILSKYNIESASMLTGYAGEEYAQSKLGGVIAVNGMKGYDILRDEERIQVKTRMLPLNKTTGIRIEIRELDFDSLAIVVGQESDFIGIIQMSKLTFLNKSTYVASKNQYILSLTTKAVLKELK